MAPRLSKRQQREQEELLTLTNSRPNLQQLDPHTTSDEEPAPPVKSGFSALFTPDDEPEAPGEESDEHVVKPTKSRKAKKKKKKATQAQASVHADTDPLAIPITSPPQPSAKSTSKNKGKKKDDIDDVDKALAELSVRYPDLKNVSTATSSDARTTALANLLSVSLTYLDAESELRKFFGSRAVTAAEFSESGSSTPHRRRRGGPSSTLRSQLTRPDRTWSLTKQREGLSLRALTEDEAARKAAKGPAGPGKWWTVEYSKRYKGATRDFTRAVMSGSPEALWSVLRAFPWHADTLLQIGDVYRHREEYSSAVDYLSRAIFAYERAFLGMFSFTSGVNRLDFDFVENRPFFLAIHQQVIDLQRRGCPRAAFEHARLLFSLQPLTDPHGSLLHLDFLAVKAGMGDWLQEVWKVYQSRYDEVHEGEEYFDPSVLPGWAYARALALREQEKVRRDRGEDVKEEGTEALKQAILEFPSIVPLLADKCEISLPTEVRSHKDFHIHTDGLGLSPEESTLHLLSHIYAIRSAPLWRSSSLGSWLASTASSVLPTFSSKRKLRMRERFLRTFTSKLLRTSIYRHVIVLEQTHAQQQHRVLTAFIPREILLAHQYACDPLPPPTARSIYNEEFFAGAEDVVVHRAARRRTRAEERQIERLVPDAATREQLLALFDQLPGFAAQMPGGVVQFVQALVQMGDDGIQDLLMAVLPEPGRHDPGAMPGGMPVDDDGVGDIPLGAPLADDAEGDDNEDDEDEDEDEEENIAPLPMRLVRNLLNRLWGATGMAQEESSDDEDTEAIVRDQDGVD